MNSRRVRVQKSFFRKGALGCARHSTRPKLFPSAYANIFFSPPEHSSIGELGRKRGENSSEQIELHYERKVRIITDKNL